MYKYNNKSILITGGTGSFGNGFLEYIIKKKLNFKRVVIFSRDEFKQSEMMKVFSPKKYKFLRFFLGDIRDKDRLYLALEDIDYVIHAAALKQVPAAEYNPWEFIKTNIIGAENLINSSIQRNVKKVIALSTDKAAAPINLYGATKLCSDKLFIAANNVVGGRDLTFSIVRYGNVVGSRGSVIPLFLKQKENNFLTVTHKDMTRFYISLEEAIEMVFWSLNNTIGGEIVVPKIPSFKIMDLVKVIAPKTKIKFIGIRIGEKLHEELITKEDSPNTIDLGKYFIITPRKYKKNYKKKLPKLKNNFSYISNDKNNLIDIFQIKKLLKKYLNSYKI